VASKKKYQVIYLNSRNQIIETLGLFIGTVGNIPVSPREIQESAIRYKADSHFSFAGEGLIEKYKETFLTLRIKAGT